MDEQVPSNDWANYERFGSIEARQYEPGDEANPCISFSLADLNRTSLAGGMIARNPANTNDQWYIAPDYFAKHYRAAHEPPAEQPMAPIAAIRVGEDDTCEVLHLYAPGLPPGEHDLYPAASSQPPSDDTARLNWLTEQQVDTIYLDDGRIIDVGGHLRPHDLRYWIDEARSTPTKSGDA